MLSHHSVTTHKTRTEKPQASAKLCGTHSPPWTLATLRFGVGHGDINTGPQRVAHASHIG